MAGYLGLLLEFYITMNALILTILCSILNEILYFSMYKYNVIYFIHVFGCLILFYSLWILLSLKNLECYYFYYQLIFDNISFFFKFLVIAFSYICVYFSYDYCKDENIQSYEYILLLLLALVGILTIIACNDLMTLYLAIELQSLCFYVVINLKFNSNFSIEAGLKYFVVGAVSSGIILYGSSLLYGFTGMTNFLDLTILFYYYGLELFNIDYYLSAFIGILFIYCGILFKIGIVPFHMWISDVYEGAPTNITLYFAVVPQISVISLLLRLNIIFLSSYLKELYILFTILSILSIVIGTLGAIYQTKLKRILAYSSISNMGYVLSLLVSTKIEHMYGVIFYIIVYNIISLGLWLLLLTLRNNSSNLKLKEIRDLVILYNSNKYYLIIFSIFLFSAMGIPPMLGFYSKFFLLLILIESGRYFFAVFIIIFSSISVIYYLRLIKLMYSYIPKNKFMFLTDIKDIKLYFLIILVYVNIFFFLCPTYFILYLHNIILFLFK